MNTTTTRTLIRRLAFGASFLTVAGVAAANSYAHMRDVALMGHQPAPLAASLPLSVDGMLVIASLALAEDKATGRAPRPWARFAFWLGAIVSVAANIASTAVHYGDALSVAVAAWPPLALLVVVEIMARPGRQREVVRDASRITPAPVVDVDPVAEVTSPSLPEAPVSPAPAGRPEWAPPVVPVDWSTARRRPVRQLRVLAPQSP